MKIIRYMIALSALGSLVMAGSALAAEKKKKKKAAEDAPASSEGDSEGGDDKYVAPYGMAGCGLGSLVIKSHGKGAQIGAAFLNATGAQISAITTGSSNCSLTKADLAMEREVFFEANFASLEKEAAQGEGQYLRAFAEVLGCSTQFTDFARLSQTQHPSIFVNGDTKQVLGNYLNAIRTNGELATGCVRVGAS